MTASHGGRVLFAMHREAFRPFHNIMAGALAHPPFRQEENHQSSALRTLQNAISYRANTVPS